MAMILNDLFSLLHYNGAFISLSWFCGQRACISLLYSWDEESAGMMDVLDVAGYLHIKNGLM